jgi:hypothetical protein
MLNQIIVLKTDVQTSDEIERIAPIFNLHHSITKWTIDIEDIDNVLRIECSDNTSEEQMIGLLNSYGVGCRELVD